MPYRTVYKKLHGMYRSVMNMMGKLSGKALFEKADRTPDEDDMPEMMFYGGDRVCEENSKDLLQWYHKQK